MVEIHYEHPTPEEWETVAQEITAIRALLFEARNRLFWVSRGLRPDDPKRFREPLVTMREVEERWTGDVRAALTPLIAYLYEAPAEVQRRAELKRQGLARWPKHPDKYRVESGWPPEMKERI